MHWPPSRGDNLNQCERWTLNGVTATYSDRGRLHVEITATTLILYKGADLATADKVAEVTGGHGAPSTRTKKTLAALNTSGITGSVWFKYAGADAVLEVYPILATDTEMAQNILDFGRWPVQPGQTTFENQHIQTREDFIERMLEAFPPSSRNYAPGGTHRGDSADLWVMNDAGDWELKKLSNVWSYRKFAIHHCMAKIATTSRVMEGADQIELLQDHQALADKAFATVKPMVDHDQDMDPDVELNPYRIYRC